MAFIYGGDTGQTQDSITDARRRMAIAMMQKGMDSSPIQSKWQGVSRLADAMMGGWDFHKEAQLEQNANQQVMSAITGQPYTPPAQSPGFLSSLFGGNKVPPTSAQGQVSATDPIAGGQSSPQMAGAPHDISGLTHNDVYNGFINTVKQGGVTNPYGLAAVAATGTAESGFDPSKMNAAWADPSQSGIPGTSGGLMSWRNERLANLRNYAQANGENPGNISPQMQAKFFLQEDPSLVQKLNAAQSPQDAASLMANAWKFAGYNRPGGEYGRRLATAQALAPQFVGQQGPSVAQGGQPSPNQVASLDPTAAMAKIGVPATNLVPLSDQERAARVDSMQPAMDQIGDNPSAAPQGGYVDPQVTTAFRSQISASPAAQAIQQQAPLPLSGGQPSDPNSALSKIGVPFTGQPLSEEERARRTAAMQPMLRQIGDNTPRQSISPGLGGILSPPDPMLTASIAPGMSSPGGQTAPISSPPPQMPPQQALAAPTDIQSQPISNPAPADLSGVGMGGGAPGSGAFPTAPGDGPARLAAALQGAPQQAAGPQGSPGAVQLAQAMQGMPQQQGAVNPVAGNPRAMALMQAMMNPNASPQARQMAGAMFQQTIAPQYDFITRPDGSVIAVNKINPNLSMSVMGPAATADSEIEKDANNNPIGVFNKRTGAYQKMGDPSAQLEFVTRPDGSVMAINKITGQPVSNPAGPMKTDSIIDGPVDPQTGMPAKLIWNAVDGVKGRLGPDGSVQPAGSGAPQQQGALPGAIPAPPPGVDPKKYREESGSIAAHDNSPTAHDEMDFANALTGRKNYQEYAAAVPTFNSFTQHIQDNSPAADKAIVDDFAKILNPGRAVTTGGFVLNMDAQGIPELLQGQIEKAVNGNGELGPDARAQMARIAQIKMQEYQGAWQLDANQGAEIAKAHHLNPDRVIPKIPDMSPIDFGKINSVKTMRGGTAPYPGSAASPAVAPQAGMPTATGPNGVKIQWNGSAWIPLGAPVVDPNSNVNRVPTGY